MFLQLLIAILAKFKQEPVHRLLDLVGETERLGALAGDHQVGVVHKQSITPAARNLPGNSGQFRVAPGLRSPCLRWGSSGRSAA
jgi:hypothetical protein